MTYAKGLAVVAAAIAALASAGIASADQSASPDSVSGLLSRVTVVDHVGAAPGYQRGCKKGQGCVFGPAWNNGESCDTRNQILAAQLHDVQFKPGTHDCKVVSGWEDDPYTGQRIDLPQVQIDHVVPLKAAWNAGASQWPLSERQHFANDPAELLAVSAHANEAKGDATLSGWLPSNAVERCPYVVQYLTVAVTYHLPISIADKAAAINMCG
jgi:hypothetical protein